MGQTLFVYEVFLAKGQRADMPLVLTDDLIVVAPNMEAAAAWVEQTYKTHDYLIREFEAVTAIVELPPVTHSAPKVVQ